MAAFVYLFREAVFGGLHFLLIVPILFVCSMAVTYFASLCFPVPSAESLADTTFSVTRLREEVKAAFAQSHWQNFYLYALLLLAACITVLVIFA